MIGREGQRLKLFLAMPDPLDYEGFCSLCVENGIEPLPVLEYAQKMGIALLATRRFPADDPVDAYLKVVNTGNSTTIALPTAPLDKAIEPVTQPETRKRCCGGGSVR